MTRPCPKCGTDNYPWRTACGVCGESLAQKQLPANAESLPIVLKATPEEVDDLPPGGKAYTAKLPLVGGVPARDFDRGYLARWGADMVAQEGRHGIGVDTLRCQYPYIYSKGALARSRRG